MVTATSDIEQIIRLTARSDVKQGLEAAKRDIQKAMNDVSFAPKGMITGARQFGDEMVKQADKIKGKFASIRQAVFNVTGISLGVGAVTQAYNFLFNSIADGIRSMSEASAATEKALRSINARLTFTTSNAETLGKAFKEVAEALSPGRRTAFDRTAIFGGIEAEAAGLAELGAKANITAEETQRLGEAALVLKSQLGTDLNEAMQALILSSKGQAEGFEKLGEIMSGEVKNAQDYEKALRLINALERERSVVRNSLTGTGGSFGQFNQEQIALIDAIRRNNQLEPPAAAGAKAKAEKDKAEALQDQAAWLAKINAELREGIDLQEKRDKEVRGLIEQRMSGGFDEADFFRSGRGEGQAAQAFADANEEARQSISTYSLVRDGIDLAAGSFIGLSRAALQGSKAIKQAAVSIIADVGGMIARFLALSAFSSIFGGFAPAGGGYEGTFDANGVTSSSRSRARGGYKGAGSRVKSFAGGTPFAGVTDGEMYLVGDNNNGREAVIPLPDGRRVPVEMRGGGGNTTVNNYHIQTIDSQSFDSWLMARKSTVANATMAELDERPSFRQAIRGT